MYEQILKWISGVALAICSFMFGGFSAMLTTVLCFMCFDIASGILKGIYLGNLSSKVAFKSLIVKKFAMLLAISVAYRLDEVAISELTTGLPTDQPLFVAMCIWFLGMETISIIENLGKIIDLPDWFTSRFEQLKKDKGDGQE